VLCGSFSHLKGHSNGYATLEPLHKIHLVGYQIVVFINFEMYFTFTSYCFNTTLYNLYQAIFENFENLLIILLNVLFFAKDHINQRCMNLSQSGYKF